MAWMGSGTGAQALARAVVLLVLARLVTPEEFGIVAAALVVVNFSNVVAQLGIGQALIQRPTLTPEHVRTGFTLSVLTGVAFCIGLWFLAPPIATVAFAMPEVVPVLRMLAFTFLLNGPAVTAGALLQRELRFKQLALIETGSFVLGFAVVGTVLGALGFGVWALAIGTLGQTVLRSIALLAAYPHAVRPQLDASATRELLYMGSGFTLGRFFNFLALQGDYFVVGRWMGSIALGAYSRAYELMVTPATLFGRVVDVVLFPVLAKVQSDRKRLTLGFLRGLALIALVTMPIGAVSTLLAPELVLVLLGPPWREVIPPFQILALGMFARSSYKISESVIRATGAVFLRARLQTVYAGCVVGFALLGRPWGLTGVASGVLAAIVVNFVLMTDAAARYAGATRREVMKVHVPALLLTLVLSLVSAASVYLLRGVEASALVTILVTVALATIALLASAAVGTRFLLGEHGAWAVRRIAALARLERFLPRTLGASRSEQR